MYVKCKFVVIVMWNISQELYFTSTNVSGGVFEIWTWVWIFVCFFCYYRCCWATLGVKCSLTTLEKHELELGLVFYIYILELKLGYSSTIHQNLQLKLGCSYMKTSSSSLDLTILSLCFFAPIDPSKQHSMSNVV
jgi:hypothetical protein